MLLLIFVVELCWNSTSVYATICNQMGQFTTRWDNLQLGGRTGAWRTASGTPKPIEKHRFHARIKHFTIQVFQKFWGTFGCKLSHVGAAHHRSLATAAETTEHRRKYRQTHTVTDTQTRRRTDTQTHRHTDGLAWHLEIIKMTKISTGPDFAWLSIAP